MPELTEASDNALPVEKDSEEPAVTYGAFLQRENSVGFAYLDSSCILHIMEDVENFANNLLPKGSLSLLLIVFGLWEPKIVLLDGTCEYSQLNEHLEKLGCEKRLVLAREFSVGKGMDILCGQHLLPQNLDLQKYALSAACTCAIFHQLLKDSCRVGGSIEKVEMFCIDGFMEVSLDALLALEIFSTESHPNSLSGRCKEGLSIFNMLNFTKSNGGKKLLRQWLRKPSCDVVEIGKRLDNVDFFVKPSNSPIIAEIWVVLRKTKNISLLFSNLRSCPKISDLESLYKLCKSLNQLMRILKNGDATCEVLQDLQTLYNEKICLEVEEKICTAVDFDKSYEFGRISFKNGINRQLDRLREGTQVLEQIVSALIRKIAEELKIGEENEIEPAYYSQLGYLVSVPLRYKPQLSDSYQIRMTSNNCMYIKDARMYELDEKFGDIHSCVVDLEIEMMQNLKESLINYKKQIIDVSLKLFEIDVLISFAVAARQFNLSRPKLENTNTILAKQCRHLLSESVCDNFIPNDVSLDSKKISILTGPNFSGKSVYLKQIGILCILAQAGCFVPAQGATIGIVDKLFTKISTKESIASGSSSFQLELEQISDAAHHATKNSLLLVDEFGKGTEFNDGIGLFCSVLQHWSSLNPNVPRIICTSHFTEAFQFLNDDSNFRWLKMDVVHEKRLNDLVFLYKLKGGLSSNSYGCQCAKLAGISVDVVKRAEEVAEKYMHFLPIEPLDIDSKYQNAQLFCNLLIDWLQRNDDESAFDELLSIDINGLKTCQRN